VTLSHKMKNKTIDNIEKDDKETKSVVIGIT